MENSKYITYSLGKHTSGISTAFEAAFNDDILDRTWNKDHTLWHPQPEEITNRLGWLDLPQTMPPKIEEINQFVDQIKQAGYTSAVLLGMGGSSLAPELFAKTFPAKNGCLDLTILDSTDPGAVSNIANAIDPQRTLFIVSTKSGGTVETLSFFKYFFNLIAGTLGERTAGQHFVAITDPGSNLIGLAEQNNFRQIFLNDPNIGGRYSALSFFGLVPAALIGIDIKKLLDRAAQINLDEGRQAASESIRLGITIGELANKGIDKLTFAISPPLASFGDWAEQLIAESVGKNGKGVLPVVSEPLADPDLYHPDRLFVSIQLESEPENQVLTKLAQAGHPTITLRLKNEYDLGYQFLFWELATAAAGYAMKIHPFNQPDVESAKVSARELIQTYQTTRQIPKGETAEFKPDVLNEFLEQIKPGDYVSIHAYLTPTEDTTEILHSLRQKIQTKYRTATTVGYGPRFLHSTGQLHKGDKGNGLFIQFISTPRHDIPISNSTGENTSSISFGILKQAQAWGDAKALLDQGRRVISFEIEESQITDIKDWEV